MEILSGVALGRKLSRSAVLLHHPPAPVLAWCQHKAADELRLLCPGLQRLVVWALLPSWPLSGRATPNPPTRSQEQELNGACCSRNWSANTDSFMPRTHSSLRNTGKEIKGRQKRKEGRERERKGRKEHFCKYECLSSLLFLLCAQVPTPTESQCPAPKSTALSLPGLGALASTATPAELTVRSSRLTVRSLLARVLVGLAGHSFPPRMPGGSMAPGATRGPPA